VARQRDLEKKALESPETVLRRILFEDDNSTWDLERLLRWISTWGDRKGLDPDGGREPAAKFVLRDKSAWRLDELAAGEPTATDTPRSSLRYGADPSGGRRPFDVLGLR